MLVLSNLDLLYDGRSATKRSLHKGVDVHVVDGRIHALRPHDAKLAPSEGRSVADCSGLVATPGLVDCHGHLTVLGLRASDMERMNGPGWLVLVEKILHATLVEGGVTSMRDIGGATHLMKRFVDEGLMLGPRLKIAICMLLSLIHI